MGGRGANSSIRKKEYIGKSYTSENVNNYFSKITNYNEFVEFKNDYLTKNKSPVVIVPNKNSTREWVDFIQKIDNNTISYSILSEDRKYSRKTKSSIKRFVKNYKINQQ